MHISREKARNRLATTWIGGFLALVLILVVQSLLGRYQQEVGKAWGWFLPVTMPSVSLIVAVLVREAQQPTAGVKRVRRLHYNLALMLSSAYLALVGLTIFLSPIAEAASGRTPLELMELSNLWLGPFQALATAALGVFFLEGGMTDSPGQAER